MIVSFLLFVLKQKVEQKIQGRRERSARPAGPAHNRQSLLVVSCTALPPYSMMLYYCRGRLCSVFRTMHYRIQPPKPTTIRERKCNKSIMCLLSCRIIVKENK